MPTAWLAWISSEDFRSQPEMRPVPIIVCSAALDAISEHQEELSRTPDLFVLPKPFPVDELESCVEEALRQRLEAPTGS